MKTNRKLNNLQLLRAFAAVSVVLLHTRFAFPHMQPFGAFGVDVFFVISGFIMARILDPAPGSNSRFFLRRRILRIVPPYWFFTLCLFCAAYVDPQLMGATRANGIDLLKSLFFIPYLKSSGWIQPILFLGWTLNFEMYFYLALAAGILLSRRFTASAAYASWLGSAIVLLIMAACTPFAAHSVLASFYSRLNVLEFVFGVASYYLCHAVPERTAHKFRIPLLFASITSAALLIAAEGIFPGTFPETLLDTTLSRGLLSFLLISAASLLTLAEWEIRARWIVLIGDASYILYLIHPYCELSLDRIAGPRHPWLRIDTAPGAILAVTLSILAAILVHIYAERPVTRFLNRRFGGKRQSTEFLAPAVP